jgi:hypothetical protein
MRSLIPSLPTLPATLAKPQGSCCSCWMRSHFRGLEKAIAENTFNAPAAYQMVGAVFVSVPDAL